MGSRKPAPDVSVAILSPGVAPRVEDALLALRQWGPRARVREVFGVGAAEDFPEGLRVVTPQRMTPAGAKTAALREARGEFALLLAADTLLDAESLGRLAAGLEARPDHVALVAWSCREAGWAMPWRRAYPGLWRETVPFSMMRTMRRLSAEEPEWTADRCSWMRLNCALLRREAALDVGPWAEGYRFGFEDAEWIRRALDKGLRVQFAAKVFAYALAPKRFRGLEPQIVRAYEESRDRLVEAFEGPRRAAAYRRVRRACLAARALGLNILSALFLGRHPPLRSALEENRWTREWHSQGRPHVPLPPRAERYVRWEHLA